MASTDASPEFAQSTKKIAEDQSVMDDINRPQVDSPISMDTSELQRVLQSAIEEEKEEFAVVDVRTVLEMFKNMNEKISSLQASQQQLSTQTQNSIRRNLEEDFNKSFQSQEEKITKLQKQLSDISRKNTLYEQILQYNTDIISDISKRLDNVELE